MVYYYSYITCYPLQYIPLLYPYITAYWSGVNCFTYMLYLIHCLQVGALCAHLKFGRGKSHMELSPENKVVGPILGFSCQPDTAALQTVHCRLNLSWWRTQVLSFQISGLFFLTCPCHSKYWVSSSSLVLSTRPEFQDNNDGPSNTHHSATPTPFLYKLTGLPSFWLNHPCDKGIFQCINCPFVFGSCGKRP